MNRTHDFYSRPSYVGGISFPVYSGSRRQRGGSIFGSALRQILPDGATVKKALGRQVMGFVGDVAKDVMAGESIGDAMKERAKERAADILSEGVKKMSNMAGQAITRNLKRKRPVAAAAAPVKRMRRRMPRGRPKRRYVSMQKFRRGRGRALFW